MTDVEFTLTDLDFQLESLDFSSLSPAEFENLVFHLLDEMGFSNLVWRKGGEGNSATDGGRDLDATYWRVEPVGSSELSYWYEVKYRTGQLEKAQVQKSVLDASANSKLDHVVIVTNSTISNPCLDWIREFQVKNPRPSISVWQGHDLEVVLRKNLRTLGRFIPTALSFSGRCKVIESRFSNLFLLPAVDELAEFWERKETLEDQTFILLAAILSESAYGDLVARPWGMEVNKEAEPPRVCRRLQSLRGWSHVEENEVFARSPRASGSDVGRARAGVRVTLGGDPVDRREDRLLSGDSAQVVAAERG